MTKKRLFLDFFDFNNCSYGLKELLWRLSTQCKGLLCEISSKSCDWDSRSESEGQRDLFHYVPPISLVTLCPPREKKCLWLIYIYLLLAKLSCYSVNQLSIYLVIANDTFYWFFLSKFPLSQSEALLDKSRSALLEYAVHVFNRVSLCPPLFL